MKPEVLARIKEEYKNLCEKCDKLYDFTQTSEFEDLTTTESTLLSNQFLAMSLYRSILLSRIRFAERGHL